MSRRAIAFAVVLNGVLFTQIVPKQPSDVKIPSDVLTMMRLDLRADEAKECLEEQNMSFERMVRAQRLAVNKNGGVVLEVRGLGTCLGSPTNGPFLVYARFSTGWRKILEDEAVEVKPIRSVTRGWQDLELWRHDSAFSNIRLVYKFNGERYEPVRCDVVQYSDYGGDQKYAKPIYHPCK